MARRDGKKVDGKKVDGKGGKNNVAGKGKGQGTQTYDGNCNYCKKYGHYCKTVRAPWQEIVARKKRTTHRQQTDT